MHSCAIILKKRRFLGVFEYVASAGRIFILKNRRLCAIFSIRCLNARPSLATYLTRLQSAGRVSFTRREAIDALGVTGGRVPEIRVAASKEEAIAQSEARLLCRRPRAISVMESAAAELVHRRPDAPRRPDLLCWSVEGGGIARRDPSRGDGISDRNQQAASENPLWPVVDCLLLQERHAAHPASHREPEDRHWQHEDFLD